MAEKKTARGPGCFGKNLAVIRAALHLSQEQLTHALLREGDIHVDGR